MENYEQVIHKLKNESEESRRIIQELELSKISEERRQAEDIRNSKIKGREEELKRAIQQRMEEKAKIAKERQQITQIPKSSPKKRKSLASSNVSRQNTSQVGPTDPNLEILKSKLEEESRAKRSLESQIKELGMEKLKLEKLIERESFKSVKET